jgi:hypothetical protein
MRRENKTTLTSISNYITIKLCIYVCFSNDHNDRFYLFAESVSEASRTLNSGQKFYLRRNYEQISFFLPFFLSFFLNRPLLPYGVEGFLLVNLLDNW